MRGRLGQLGEGCFDILDAADQPWPPILQPAKLRSHDDLVHWASEQRTSLRRVLADFGALRFRGFGSWSPAQLRDFIDAASAAPLAYSERSSPRTEVESHIYTSTEYPPEETIPLHNESSYAQRWPRLIFFYCDVPPESGGETPLADCRKVLARLDRKTRERFESRRVLYRRAFNTGLGLTWQAVFRSDDRNAVETRLRALGYQFAWDGDILRTSRSGPAIVRHPDTGQESWFNHACFFHISSLPPEVKEALVEGCEEEDWPANTYYGDGAPIEEAVLAEIREAYAAESVYPRWQTGDLVVVDNMIVAHGRAPFAGARRILVGMSEAWGEDLSLAHLASVSPEVLRQL